MSACCNVDPTGACGTTTCSEDQGAEILDTLAGSATALGVAAINQSKPAPAPIVAPNSFSIQGSLAPPNIVIILLVLGGIFLLATESKKS